MTAMTVVPPASEAASSRETTVRLGHGAVLRAIEKNTVGVAVPALGRLHLPPPQTLAWLAGLTALAALEIVEWPVAVAIGAGHVLAHQSHLQLLRDFGQALEEA